MFKNIITIFVLLSFTFSVLAELNEFDSPEKSIKSESIGKSILSDPSVSFIKDTDCDDCETESCDDDVKHCSHHCSGIHNILARETGALLDGPIARNITNSWLYSLHYIPPFIASATKPPKFS